MTVKKAIKMLDWWITQGEKKIKELDTTFKFNDSELRASLLDNENVIIKNLKQIRKQIVPNCKHPKNMQDRCGGILYCMGCNLDL